MQFNIGDKVLFKTNKLKGRILEIKSPYKVIVVSTDGFELEVNIKELVRIERQTDKASSYGNFFSSKDSKLKSEKLEKRKKTKTKTKTKLKIDLHIELLKSNFEYMHNSEIIRIQLDECHRRVQQALNSKVTQLEIVHGIGEGVLRAEVHSILRSYQLRFYISKDGGSTEVFL